MIVYAVVENVKHSHSATISLHQTYESAEKKIISCDTIINRTIMENEEYYLFSDHAYDYIEDAIDLMWTYTFGETWYTIETQMVEP